MQPLDVGVFGSVQRQWRSHCDECATVGKKINRYMVIHEYMKVRKQKITPDLICKSFEKTGIYPINCNVFKDEDFTPSQSFSHHATMGASYPDEVLTSDSAISSDSESDCDDDDEYAPANFLINSPRMQFVDDQELHRYNLDEPMGIENMGAPKEEHNNTNFCSPEIPDPTASRPVTWSTSNILSLNEALQKDIAVPFVHDERRSHEDLLAEVRSLRSHIHVLTCTVQSLYAQLWASNAHCTISKQKCDDSQECYDNSIKRQQHTSKLKERARYITHPQLKEAFEEEDHQRREHEEDEKRKQQEKDAEAAAHEARLSD
ncbi:hypothetical protein BDQ17DRAFT_1421842 [Cyathus striatus]|nr:hypothetical protein BDQ17DRAFT_1421842 [Cyathus striatus]